MQDILYRYQNGNTTVTILTDGTKIREYEDIPIIEHPESIDVKITDYCDMGCSYCHESSTKEGIHADLDKLYEILSPLPKGVELALGGGNPLSHPNLIEFLQKLKEKGLIANLTINQGHLKTYQDMILYLIDNDLVKGVGISITNSNFKYIKPLLERSNNIVAHVIAGVNKVDIIEDLKEIGLNKILVLGYKQFGFGIDFYSNEVEKNIKEWYIMLPKYLQKVTLCFDNLAIEQLNIKRFFTEEGWEQFYMGDDFTFTMYIDAVKQNYAPTSRSNDRHSFAIDLLTYFQNFKYDYKVF